MTIPPQLDKRRLAAGAAKPNTADERRRAALYAADRAHSVADCTDLLDALGLTPHDARQETP